MSLTLDEGRRAQLIGEIQGFYRDEFDEHLSEFRAERLLEFVLTRIGPPVYNQAVQDARRYMLDRLEDLDGEVHEPEGV